MIVFRKRLILWLIKAYMKKWGKTIFIYFVAGLFIFFILRFISGVFSRLPFDKRETIGIVGSYTVDNLPGQILSQISYGLTRANEDGTASPLAAEKWKIINNGKVYVFYLKKDIYFSDGTNLTSDLIRYNFSDVAVEHPNKYTIVFKLKDNYSPFLITVSRPIFKKGFNGIGEYRIKNIRLNGNFVESLDLAGRRGQKAIAYQFYPTAASVKDAFILGEISGIQGLADIQFRNTGFDKFKNTEVKKSVDYRKLVTLFYNNRNDLVSSKNLREALSFSIPDSFEEGIRNSTPLSPLSFAAQKGLAVYNQDLSHAKLLLDKAKSASPGAELSLTLDTLSRFEPAAKKISKIWESLGIKVKVQVVDKIPQNFQVFLGEFNVSLDPDQYVLWHSEQTTNITHYVNLRIDKILEDGRKEVDIEKRKTIYADFQKFIFADPPAAFLYFPYTYEVTRK